MTTITAPPASNTRSQGRKLFWFGILVCLLGPALMAGQFLVLKYLAMPWYSPALATLGALLLLVAVLYRRSIPRLIGFVLIAAFAGFQWFFLSSVMKLPAYEGTARAGNQMPAFSATPVADGKTFTDADLRDGNRRVVTFFRGRW
jgi:hypothetical protein